MMTVSSGIAVQPAAALGMIPSTMLRGLWAYRGFVLGSVKREFQSKYRNAMLGAAWTVLNPLAMILVYTVIFSQVMHSSCPASPRISPTASTCAPAS